MRNTFSKVKSNFDLRSIIAIWPCEENGHACRPGSDSRLTEDLAAQHTARLVASACKQCNSRHALMEGNARSHLVRPILLAPQSHLRRPRDHGQGVKCPPKLRCEQRSVQGYSPAIQPSGWRQPGIRLTIDLTIETTIVRIEILKRIQE